MAYEHLNWTPRMRANASGWIRERHNLKLDEDDVEYLADLKTPSVAEKAHKLMRFIGTKYPDPGHRFMIPFRELSDALRIISKLDAPSDLQQHLESAKESLPWLSVAWASEIAELEYVVQAFLIEEKGFLLMLPDYTMSVTPGGWSALDLAGVNEPGDNAFVAMWFDSTTEHLWMNAIEPGITDAGYKPVRIDKTEHNNKIDDEILASIRRCKFIVADFTGQRGGVYFEAGFALGLNMRVIWLCRKEDLSNVHFDVRQRNFICWQDGMWDELRTALTNRIVGDLGTGKQVQISSH